MTIPYIFYVLRLGSVCNILSVPYFLSTNCAIYIKDEEIRKMSLDTWLNKNLALMYKEARQINWEQDQDIEETISMQNAC